MNEEELQIVIQARNDTKRAFKQVDADLAKVQKMLGGVTGSMVGMGKEGEKSLSGISSGFNKSTIAAGALGAGIVGAAAIGMKALKGLSDTVFNIGVATFQSAGQLEKTRVAFETMLGSAEAAGRLLREMTEFAASTPFDLPGVQKAGQQLLAMGAATADNVIPTLKMVGDVTAGVSGDLDQVILAFSQVAAKGKLTGEELRQLSSVPLKEELAKNLGIAISQVSDFVEKGEVGFSDVRKAFETMTGEGGKFFNLMDKQATTLPGIIQNLSDNFGMLGRAIIGIDAEGVLRPGGLIEQAKGFLNGLYKAIEPNIDGMIALGDAVINAVKMALTPFLGRLRDIDAVTLQDKLATWTASVTTFGNYLGIAANRTKQFIDAVKIIGTTLIGSAKLVMNFGQVVAQGISAGLHAATQEIGQFVGYAAAALGKLFKGDLGGAKETIAKAFDIGDITPQTAGVESAVAKMKSDFLGMGMSISGSLDSIHESSARIQEIQVRAAGGTETWGKSVSNLGGEVAKTSGELEEYAESADGAGKSTSDLAAEQRKAEQRTKDFARSFKTLTEKLKDSMGDFKSARKSARKEFKKFRKDAREEIQGLRKDLRLAKKDLGASIGQELFESQERLADAQGKLTDIQADRETALAELRKKHMKELEGDTKTIIRSQVAMNRQTGDILSATQTTTTETTLPDNIADIKSRQQEELAQVESRYTDEMAIVQEAISAEQNFLQKHSNDLLKYSEQVNEARREAGLSSIEILKEQFQAERDNIKTEISDVKESIKEARKARNKEIKQARKQLKKEFKQIKKDASQLADDLAAEFTKVPEAVAQGIKKVGNQLKKVSEQVVNNNTTNNNTVNNITFNGNDAPTADDKLANLQLILKLL